MTGEGCGAGGDEVTGDGSGPGGSEVTGDGSGPGGDEAAGDGGGAGEHELASHWQAVPPRRTWAATGTPATEMPRQMPTATGPIEGGTDTDRWGSTAGPPSVTACAGPALAAVSSAPVSSAQASGMAGSTGGMAAENRWRCPQGIGASAPLTSRHEKAICDRNITHRDHRVHTEHAD